MTAHAGSVIEHAPTKIDARGLRCPWPALRLARALRETPGSIEITVDDPAAESELASVAAAHNATLTRIDALVYRVVTSPAW